MEEYSENQKTFNDPYGAFGTYDFLARAIAIYKNEQSLELFNKIITNYGATTYIRRFILKAINNYHYHPIYDELLAKLKTQFSEKEIQSILHPTYWDLKTW